MAGRNELRPYIISLPERSDLPSFGTSFLRLEFPVGELKTEL